MIDYIYRGFKLSYRITENKTDAHFQAEGTAVYLFSQTQKQAARFHTEASSYLHAEHEIKKMLESYADFELSQACKMAESNV